jgi:hypothetical protein
LQGRALVVMPVISYSGGGAQEDCGSKPARANIQEIQSQKYSTQNRACALVQVVDHLPSKHEALSSNPFPFSP